MPNMSNNTSLYDYYNYDNFKVEHAPNNFAAQPRRLLPEQINMNKNVDNEDYDNKDYDNEDYDNKDYDNNEDKKILESDKQKENETKPGMTDQLAHHVRNFGNFFKDILEDKPILKDEVKPSQNTPNVPDTVPEIVPETVKPLVSKPIPVPNPPVQDNLPGPPNVYNDLSVGGASLRPTQLGGGATDMDMRSLMRKNRMLQNRIHILERDLYKSSH